MNELNLFLFITNICVILLCGALLPIMPLLTRKSFLFGVKVPPEAQNTNEARALKKRYVAATIIGSVLILAVAVIQYIIMPKYTFHSVMIIPLVIAAVQFAAFVPNNKKALKLKSQLDWNIPEIQYADTATSFTRGNLSAMPHFWYVISLLLIFALFIIAAVRYPGLPDKIPTHWNIKMEPDAWSEKSIGSIAMSGIVDIVMLAAMWLTGIFTEKSKLQIDHKEPAKSFAQHKKYRRLMGHSIGFLTFTMIIMFFLIGLQSVFVGFTVPFWLLMVLIGIPSILVCVISVRAGQGGVLLKVDVQESAAESGDIADNNAMSDDKYWAWGLFYHNPDDPSCFVGDRFGINLGFNYSRLPVKIGVAVGVVLLAVSYIWAFAAFKL